MPPVTQVLRMRQRREGRASRRPGWRLGLIAGIGISLIAALAGVFLAFSVANLTRNLPSIELLPQLLDPVAGQLLQPSQVYDRTGSELIYTFDNPAVGSRRFLPANLPVYGQAAPRSSSEASEIQNQEGISRDLVEATLAVADPYFWEHLGFSLSGILENGHPTLAERLVSDLLLWDEPPSLRRALRERLLAYQITVRFGREQVLTWYLNSAKYGPLVYGAEAAAQAYFGKSANSLNLAEAAMLAALADTPALNPHDAPTAALERQRQILRVMHDRRFITDQQVRQAQEIELDIQPAVMPSKNTSPAFIGLVLDELETLGLRERLERGGFQITTTLDSRLQAQASCTAKIHINRLSEEPALEAAALPTGCEAARLLPTLPPSPGPPNLLAEVVLLDPRSGQLLAVVQTPAVSTGAAQFYPRLSRHPAGTLWTPVIYLTAFSRGLSPATLVWDLPPGSADNDELKATPVNFDGQYHGPVRLRVAFANDYLAAAAEVLEQVGSANIWETARQLGLGGREESDDQRSSLFENGPGVTLLQASRAFGVFAHDGILAGSGSTSFGGPITILSIEDTNGASGQKESDLLTSALGKLSKQEKPVTSPQLAYLVTHVLSDEAARWPSLGHPNPLEVGRPAAAKLGQTAGGRDAWAVGYTPELVVGTWLGADPEAPQSSASIGVNPAAALWHAIIQYATREEPARDWSPPAGITSMDVCDPSGLLPSPECPNIVPEVFLDGTEPAHYDSLFHAIEINRETGRLATIFTPLDLIEEQVYMLVPPEAQAWAQQVGLATPPKMYDVIPITSPASSDVQITSPELFAYVRGKVSILGQASGQDFESYRIQVGKGLNPPQWLKIAGDTRTPVLQGRLGVWDTQGLEGVYIIQLLVVRAGQQVETAAIQVTVDNQPPELQILYPVADQPVSASDGQFATFQVRALDNLAIESVKFFVDGKLLATAIQPPYSAQWKVSPGEHTLRVQATDVAQNEAEMEVKFSAP